MPNLVHSLDAASLCLLIESYFSNNNSFYIYSIHDCFAVPCSKVSNLLELLKTVYCIIYSDSKYLQVFDRDFREDIISIFGKEAVTFNDKNGKVTVTTNTDTITIKYPSLNHIIDNNSSNIVVKNSNYLLH